MQLFLLCFHALWKVICDVIALWCDRLYILYYTTVYYTSWIDHCRIDFLNRSLLYSLLESNLTVKTSWIDHNSIDFLNRSLQYIPHEEKHLVHHYNVQNTSRSLQSRLQKTIIMGPYLHQYALYECTLYLILTLCVHYILQCITLADHYSLQYNMSLPLQYSI